MNTNFVCNHHLRIIKEGWEGNPLDKSGNFTNLTHLFSPNFLDVIKWKLRSNPQKDEKKLDDFKPNISQGLEFIESDKDCIVWLGHASFFIRLGGFNIIVDPVFYDVPLVKRLFHNPFDPKFFQNLDYILISHDHRDHCQKKSLELLSVNNPEARILTGLRMRGLLESWSLSNEIQEAGWYQQYNTGNNLEICYLPSRHWAKRGAFDNNSRLWGSFHIKIGEKTIFYSGDTGYDTHFAEIKNLFSSPDICIIGVGAYKPEWFMHPNHISPGDAVRAFNEMGGKTMIPMHYGTFDLSDEPAGEPIRVLNDLVRKQKLNGQLKVLGVGEEFLL